MTSSGISTREEILQKALALAPADRAFVAAELERSLPDSSVMSEEIADAWSREIDRRIDAYERGESKSLDINSALDHARQVLLERASQRANP